MAKPPKPLGVGMIDKSNPVTVIEISEYGLSQEDEKVLCGIICSCRENPNIGKTGNNLFQSCVSGKLKILDRSLNYQSIYKPEVTYDMHTQPPAPVMSKTNPTEPHGSVIGWLNKYWKKEKGYPFKAKEGMLRRPDVVIVKDPTKPPTQDNIKNIVEIKFDDGLGKNQKSSYEQIAGNKDKVIILDTEKCGCTCKKQPQEQEVSVMERIEMTIMTAKVFLMPKIPLSGTAPPPKEDPWGNPIPPIPPILPPIPVW